MAPLPVRFLGKKAYANFFAKRANFPDQSHQSNLGFPFSESLSEAPRRT